MPQKYLTNWRFLLFLLSHIIVTRTYKKLPCVKPSLLTIRVSITVVVIILGYVYVYFIVKSITYFKKFVLLFYILVGAALYAYIVSLLYLFFRRNCPRSIFVFDSFAPPRTCTFSNASSPLMTRTLRCIRELHDKACQRATTINADLTRHHVTVIIWEM